MQMNMDTNTASGNWFIFVSVRILLLLVFPICSDHLFSFCYIVFD